MFPRTPAWVGFSIRAKVKERRGGVVRAEGKQIEDAIVARPDVPPPCVCTLCGGCCSLRSSFRMLGTQRVDPTPFTEAGNPRIQRFTNVFRGTASLRDRWYNPDTMT